MDIKAGLFINEDKSKFSPGPPRLGPVPAAPNLDEDSDVLSFVLPKKKSQLFPKLNPNFINVLVFFCNCSLHSAKLFL